MGARRGLVLAGFRAAPSGGRNGGNGGIPRGIWLRTARGIKEGAVGRGANIAAYLHGRTALDFNSPDCTIGVWGSTEAGGRWRNKPEGGSPHPSFPRTGVSGWFLGEG